MWTVCYRQAPSEDHAWHEGDEEVQGQAGGEGVGDVVRVDSLLGGRKVTEKMKQTFRSKRSSSLTNGDRSHTVVKAVTEKDDNTTSIENNSLPTPVTAQARILEKLKLSKQQTQGGGEGFTAGNMAVL